MKNKRISLSEQLGIVMILLVFGTVLLSWLINSTFLEKYYMYNKQKEIVSAYSTIDETSAEGGILSDEFAIRFEKMCANSNIDIIIYSDQYNIILSSMNNTDRINRFINNSIGQFYGSEKETIKVTDDYIVIKNIDERMNEEYMTLYGSLEDGTYVYIRTPIESIKESADIAGRFVRWIGMASLLISVIVIVFVSRSISRPIRNLTDISKRMSNLDFEAKYHEQKYSPMEIEELGAHMNELSNALENTISELKSANNELKQDLRKKEQIDEMRKEFLSNVSHELKTPLALIQGYSEGLKECINEDAESRDFYCDVIMDETDKMTKMVKKLLTLNQLEFGNEVVELVRFNLTELVEGVVNASMLLASANEIKINFTETSPVYVWGDEFKVEEVVTNYISNAINHCSGEKRIDVFMKKHDGLVRLCVFNTGNPIPVEELDKIWIKFYKVDKARTREYGGNGIGLSIVKAIMDSFNQECGVVNHENGVEFWMELDANN